MSPRAKVLVHSLCAVAVMGLFGTAWSVTGDASLFVPGATNTPTHFNVQIGVPVVVEIHGVPTQEVGDPLPATLDVWVKSSLFGNTQLVATRIDDTNNYTFTYTPPAIANGDDFNACGTTTVAYKVIGRIANNDYCDDGLRNGTADAGSGLRFVDANGNPLTCQTVGVESTPWGKVKSHYRD